MIRMMMVVAVTILMACSLVGCGHTATLAELRGSPPVSGKCVDTSIWPRLLTYGIVSGNRYYLIIDGSRRVAVDRDTFNALEKGDMP